VKRGSGTAEMDTRSLVSEWRDRLWGQRAEPSESADEKAAALRDYQGLVRRINDAIREQEAERRAGVRDDT